ncbi:MAG: permease-like cell division protein FtsX [Persicimonas sp.]
MSLETTLRPFVGSHPLRALVAVAVLFFALLLPSALALVACVTTEVADGYLDAFRPVVYLEAGAQTDEADALVDELQSWSAVKSATVRTPGEAHADLNERLGPDETARLGVDEGMLPYSIVVEPTVPVFGHARLLADVSALEVRSHIARVDIPSGKAVEALSVARWMLAFGILLAVGSLLAGLGHLRDSLVRRAEHDAERRRLLEMFGATPGSLSRPILTGGVTVGAVAGVAATVALGLVLAVWYGAQPQLIGQSFRGSGGVWLTLFVPMAVGPLIGLAAGWLANRQLRGRLDFDELDLRDMLA